MKILVLNCGSSSIKYQLFDMTSNAVLAKGSVDRIGLAGSSLKHDKDDNGSVIVLEGEIIDHKQGVEYILGVLISKKYGCIKNLKEINAVGHRVVNGGENFNKSVLISEQVIEEIKECINIAPLHNPHNLNGIYSIEHLLPGIPQVAVFDTAFHQTIPKHAYMYAIPYSLYEKYGIRRYGFHGTSFRYVTKKACELLKMDISDKKIIACHLGNGGSVAAVKNGESVDTSMGFTPVEGLIMGTRTGDLDIGVLTYVMEKEELNASAIGAMLNKHSGLLGVSGISSDMREIMKNAAKGKERSQLAIDMFVYRIKKYIGAYAAAMGGVDIVVITGGIGENNPDLRESICEGFEYLGMKISSKVNDSIKGTDAVISNRNSRVKIAMIQTDEELVIAEDTYAVVKDL